MKKVALFFLVIFIFLFVRLDAQISVASPQGLTPLQLINSTLVLPPIVSGVYISNATFNNQSGPLPTTTTSKIGTFTNGYNFADFPMNRGIIMTSGNITVAPGPNSSGSLSSTNNDNTTDADLQALTTNSLEGMAKLEFDFLSVSGNVQFEYIFASEEYPEFVCSSYNDIFAFFLTGPHPVTQVLSTWNIALIPGSTLPVSINSVNPGFSGSSGTPSGCSGVNQSLAYSSYYTDVPSGSPGIQFDGFTRIPGNSPYAPFGVASGLFAKSRIMPCTTYHMKLAVANCQDNSYDSGVFLKQGSFISPSEFKNYHSFTYANNPDLVQNLNSDTIHYLILPPDSTRDYTIFAFADSAHCDAVFNEDYEVYYMDTEGDTLVKSDDFVTTFLLEAGHPSTKIVIRVPETAVFAQNQEKLLKLILKVETCPSAIPIVDTMYFNLRAAAPGEYVAEFTPSLLTIAPNPSDGRFTITHQNATIEEYQVYDISGRLVGGMRNINAQECVLDATNYTNGVYFVKVKTETGSIVKKIVKQ
ncbi:MAG TPA: choice-of-anchor L domain-containing protein [Bacteroidales bacterium]|nr:choice-of-anchor L domain-containing protein [Bacteroidales bacterium]HPS70756.1 choice-of-anchor L domain-containing protein [Bacteroidales bacterium]